MNFQNLFGPAQANLSATLPMVLKVVGILVVGWLIAMLVGAAVRKGLAVLTTNDKAKQLLGNELPRIDRIGGKIVFWVVMLFTIIAVFNVLNLDSASSSLQALVDPVMQFVPNILGAAILALVAWVVAIVVRVIARKGLDATSLDEKLAAAADVQPFSTSISNILYWITLLLFLPAILGSLEMQSLLEPVQGMVDQMLAMLPNIFGAVIIGLLGWFVAKILRDLVYNLLAAMNFDRFGEKAGLQGNVVPSRLVALLVFIFVFVPALIASLNALKIDAISEPATEMLTAVLNAIPNIFAAAVILGVAYVLAKFIANLLESLLDGLGFNQLPAKMGIAQLSSGSMEISKLASRIVSFFIMLFATVEAANRLDFGQVSELVTMFIEFGGQVLLGSVILAIGFWLANVIYQGVLQLAGQDAKGAASLARVAVLALVIAMGLRAMGIADDIVNMAFALTLGAVAVAIALSFGLGGREAAGKQMEYWLAKLRK